MDIQTRREREKQTVSYMIALYCRKKHGRRDGLCSDCAALDTYARQRSDKCPFMAVRHVIESKKEKKRLENAGS